LAGLGGSEAGKRDHGRSRQSSEKKLPAEPPQLGGAKMTAEIAILNKTAVALAADSAVTIRAGQKEEKIFNSADKLFELSNADPIGVMIYNGTSFMEIPLPSLIREFRRSCPPHNTINTVSNSFLEYLTDTAAKAPQDVADRSIIEMATDALCRIEDQFKRRFQSAVQEIKGVPDGNSFVKMMDSIIKIYEFIYGRRPPANFYKGNPRLSRRIEEVIRRVVDQGNFIATPEQEEKLVSLLKMTLKKRIPNSNSIGLVFAGFGRGELFPSLISVELDGAINGKIKYRKMQEIDIDRSGPRARVLPFAQKEMVERFLYGLDADVERHIRLYCSRNISSLREKVIGALSFEANEDKEQMTEALKSAEDGFIEGLQEEAFDAGRKNSQSEIEDMVEFMPKPELAKMAESLVNLTSIKRQVSRGMETVGGPIDVAVISPSEGFVWVRRKHSFPQELNFRYFERVRSRVDSEMEVADAEK
jgi:hypothetical protein